MAAAKAFFAYSIRNGLLCGAITLFFLFGLNVKNEEKESRLGFKYYEKSIMLDAR